MASKINAVCTEGFGGAVIESTASRSEGERELRDLNPSKVLKAMNTPTQLVSQIKANGIAANNSQNYGAEDKFRRQ
ncbi:hypothetical protein GQ55_3G404800 [Panicum hallii var. hallii]|uniref:Uncharacterized protein n=1 Tax=Panicum hallii var. hallii TaxID=1504633 RepID=A0A2T7EGY7_9POAL|nr:hypothetical protein GQ55_3G404800 [Panicum hallii var. hallii]